MAERWQTSEGRVAACFFRNDTGSPVTGLTPTAAVLHKDGSGGAPTANVVEVGNGFYRVVFSAAPTKDVLVRVDGGGTLSTTRYVALEVPVGGYVDQLDAAISTRATALALAAVQADTDALQTDTATLLARLTALRAAALDFLDVAVSTRATPADLQVTVTAAPTINTGP